MQRAFKDKMIKSPDISKAEHAATLRRIRDYARRNPDAQKMDAFHNYKNPDNDLAQKEAEWNQAFLAKVRAFEPLKGDWIP